MREIKFRAWCNIEKKMYQKFYVEDHMKFAFMDELIHSAQGRYTLMQFTGLRDKNDVEIYEGDVLYFPTYETHTNNRVVKFELGQFVGELIRSNYSKSLKEIANEMEVIGNTYENPELLEGKR